VVNIFFIFNFIEYKIPFSVRSDRFAHNVRHEKVLLYFTIKLNLFLLAAIKKPSRDNEKALKLFN